MAYNHKGLALLFFLFSLLINIAIAAPTIPKGNISKRHEGFPDVPLTFCYHGNDWKENRKSTYPVCDRYMFSSYDVPDVCGSYMMKRRVPPELEFLAPILAQNNQDDLGPSAAANTKRQFTKDAPIPYPITYPITYPECRLNVWVNDKQEEVAFRGEVEKGTKLQWPCGQDKHGDKWCTFPPKHHPGAA